MTNRLRDAVNLLRTISGPCDEGATAHAWRKCKRCSTMHLLENRDPLVIELFTVAIQALQKK